MKTIRFKWSKLVVLSTPVCSFCPAVRPSRRQRAASLPRAMGGYVAGTETAENTSTTTVYTTQPPAGYTSLPCSPNVVPANGVTYYQCGSTWYTQAYGGSGVSYTVVARLLDIENKETNRASYLMTGRTANSMVAGRCGVWK